MQLDVTIIHAMFFPIFPAKNCLFRKYFVNFQILPLKKSKKQSCTVISLVSFMVYNSAKSF